MRVSREPFLPGARVLGIAWWPTRAGAKWAVRIGIWAWVFAITGCAAPEVRYQPVEVNVPVLIPCAVKAVEKPDFEVDKLKPEADDFAVAKAYRAERKQRDQYERELAAAAAGCAKQ